MKTALKWIGWCVLGLIAIGALGSADKLGQTILIVCGVVAYIAIDYAKHLRARHEELVEAIARLQRNLEAVHREVSHVSNVLDGMEHDRKQKDRDEHDADVMRKLTSVFDEHRSDGRF